MDILGRKDSSLRALVAELVELLPVGSFVVIDHWEADPFAIGLARPTDHSQLVYVSSSRDDNGRYFMAREVLAQTDLEPFSDAGADAFDDVHSLAKAIAAHLGAA
jgi:hypothetical protein